MALLGFSKLMCSLVWEAVVNVSFCVELLVDTRVGSLLSLHKLEKLESWGTT